MSRGRIDNRLYAVAGVDLDREDTGGQVARPVDPVAALTRSLARSRAKELALDATDLGDEWALAEGFEPSSDLGVVPEREIDELDAGLEL